MRYQPEPLEAVEEIEEKADEFVTHLQARSVQKDLYNVHIINWCILLGC